VSRKGGKIEMGDILDVIISRRSIRQYTADSIPDELLDKILEAARWAPTGHNDQPWRLIVVKDPETKKRIGRLKRLAVGTRETAYYGIGARQVPRIEAIQDREQKATALKMMYATSESESVSNAAVLIVVLGSMLDGELNVPYDLAACMENMILEAHSLGIGSCWVHAPVAGTRDAVKFKKLLKIPTGMGEYKVLAVLSLGWPLEGQPRPRPKKPLEAIVYWEEFGRKERS